MGGAILVLGSGPEVSRRYFLAGLARRHTVLLLTANPATWEAEIVARHATVDLADPAAVLAAGRRLVGSGGDLAGVFTWNELLLPLVAWLGEQLGTSALPADAARVCRDKALQRALFTVRGVPSASYRTVDTAEEARAAAEEIGVPVVLKPRSLAGSIGVQLVRDLSEVATAFRTIREATFRGNGGGGVLVEEALTGVELSVDSWVLDGEVVPYLVAVKQVGFPPHFEEVGHSVGLPLDPDVSVQVVAAVTRANLAVGADRMATHTELILTSRGPRLVEVNGRPGGDMIPYLGSLVSDLDPGDLAATVTTGSRPGPVSPPSGMAAIRFRYPPHDLQLTEVDVDPRLSRLDWVHGIWPTSEPGDLLRLPPRQHLGRAATVIVTADDEATLHARIETATAGVSVRGTPLSDGRPEPLAVS